MNLLGVILSGGASSRMGQDKGLMLYKKKPMVEHTIDLLTTFCYSIVISANNEEYKAYPHTIVQDIKPNIGPIGGIYSVMKTIEAEYYFISSCDTPHTQATLVQMLLDNTTRADVIVPVHSGGKVEPLFGVYSRKALPFIEQQINNGNFKLMHLLKECNTYYLPLEAQGLKNVAGMFKNINTAQDVE